MDVNQLPGGGKDATHLSDGSRERYAATALCFHQAPRFNSSLPFGCRYHLFAGRQLYSSIRLPANTCFTYLSYFGRC